MSQHPHKMTLTEIEKEVLNHPVNSTYRNLYTKATGIVPKMPSQTRDNNIDIWYQYADDCIWHLEGNCQGNLAVCPRYHHFAKQLQDVQNKITQLESELEHAPTN